jgi:hypothetical protein
MPFCKSNAVFCAAAAAWSTREVRTVTSLLDDVAIRAAVAAVFTRLRVDDAQDPQLYLRVLHSLLLQEVENDLTVRIRLGIAAPPVRCPPP